MSSHNSERASIEERGLLMSTSFEIGDVESAEQHNHPLKRSAHDWLDARKAWKKFPSWSRLQSLLVGLAAAIIVTLMIVILVLLARGKPAYEAQKHRTNTHPTWDPPKLSPAPNTTIPYPTKSKFEKPRGFKIIALVFFGRAPTVAILDCYLKKNLVSNGGFLDEVHWAVNTENQDDIHYLEGLLRTSPLYKKKIFPLDGYVSVWENAVEADHMYIKLDDDIVYLNEDAIPDLVFSKLKHTEALNVVANLINSPETGWLHYHVGAVHAYLPEWDPPPPDVDGASYGPKAWRASALPQWNSTTASKKANESDFMGPHPAPPPFDGHRWLPLPKDEVNLYRTPIADAKYDPFGDDWTSWAIAAQVQYSLLENIENDQLSRYWYGHGDNRREGIWNMAYERMNINVMVIWGKDVVDNLPFEGRDDEYELSITLPRKLRRPLLVNTHVIAGHLGFGPQRDIYQTDLLSRYRAYANEMICTPDNQISVP